mmetsp:Transcript_52825/g.171906  ORF Transcript_52825/g.171906 Transcript_52825/m.171906 type:complete len:216 (+) Transcript_52825:160-807(+)
MVPQQSSQGDCSLSSDALKCKRPHDGMLQITVGWVVHGGQACCNSILKICVFCACASVLRFLVCQARFDGSLQIPIFWSLGCNRARVDDDGLRFDRLCLQQARTDRPPQPFVLCPRIRPRNLFRGLVGGIRVCNSDQACIVRVHAGAHRRLAYRCHTYRAACPLPGASCRCSAARAGVVRGWRRAVSHRRAAHQCSAARAARGVRRTRLLPLACW